MAKTLTFDMDGFRQGLQLLSDDSLAPPGSARRMLNVLITDRGGIAPRPGIELLGERNTDGVPSDGFYVFKKAFGAKEIPIKAYSGAIYAYHAAAGWFKIKDGFTGGEEFDFISNLVNTDNADYTYYCNRYEPFQRWTGQIALIEGALTGGETEIVVDSTLEEDIFEEDVATGTPTTTVIDVADTPWVASQWINFYIYITSGTQIGQVRKITASTNNQLTFDALDSAPSASDTFEIRQLLFNLNETDQFYYNGVAIQVTAIKSSTELTVASAHVAPDGTPIVQEPVEFPGAPRGNRLDTLLGRTLVGNVRSAVARDAGGALQGSNSAGSIFVSQLNDPTDFTYSATRIASEGDIISMPYGGGDITDISVQEEVAYVYKKTYIEAIQYTQDIDDYAVRTPLKTGAGSIGKVIKGKDDHYVISLDKQFTSIGRVVGKDQTVQTENIGLPIKRLLDEYGFTDVTGAEFRNRILFSCRSDLNQNQNNVTVVWNKTTKTFEGIWNLGAFGFDTYLDELYFAGASDANVYKMFIDEKSDILSDTEKIPITAVWESNFFNLLPVKGNIQSIKSINIEGYIGPNTEFQFDLYKDFSTDSALTFSFSSIDMDDEQFMLGDNLAAFLGNNPLGVDPLGTIDAPGADGRRRFSFLIYFPFIYGQYFSTSIQSEGEDQDWEIIRTSLGLSEDISTKVSSIKVI